MFLWLKAFHIIAMVTWFAGLFYLPRLFVYHANTKDAISLERFKIMERRLYFAITTPGGLLTLLLGTWLFMLNPSYYLHAGWMHAKLFFVLILVIFHLYCGKMVKAFAKGTCPHSETFFRLFNEIPTVVLFAVIILVVVKPF